MLELIINKNVDTETICLVENGKLVEKYQDNETTKENRLEGNIYAGKVSDLVPGMQSAFIDYGDSRKGLLHLKDALPQVNEKNKKNENITNKNISDVLKSGQKVLIQIKKDSNDKKGAKVSTHISIPSKYVVFMPNTDIITISQKIEDEKRIKELLDLAKDNLSKNNGIVIRTSAEEASNEEIIQDIKRCTDKWNYIIEKYSNSKDIELIYYSENVQSKILLDRYRIIYVN